MIVRPTEFNLPRFVAESRLKFAICGVCRELEVKGNFQLATMWHVELEEENRQTLIDLVNEEVRNSAGCSIT